ncbi:hypothetical protein SLS56_000530 [Neofusicoccum ribis]|uniref:Fatty acid desaturase domain-containing protein n=1 Tax=Neofusicoccum ribis TaxID=45134 RepID=A0ABR3TD66_9PEZI
MSVAQTVTLQPRELELELSPADQTISLKATSKDPAKCPSLADLKRAIPAHCFQPKVAVSMAYLARDIAFVTALVYGALQIHHVESFAARTALWILYGFAQGCVFTGLWILAHECGHGAFSRHPRLNDVVGWLAHSALGVPYFSWKISHARHHRFTGHIEKDLVFVPRTVEEVAAKMGISIKALEELTEDTPIVTTVKLLAHQLLGWQTYLLFNVSAGHKSRVRDNDKRGWFSERGSHFDPWSVLFLPQQAHLIIISDIGLAITGYILYQAAQVLDWQTVALLWVVPYVWVHHWLIAITYLHHTHPEVPHYSEDTWNFTLGNLCTIDRDFGFVGTHLFHGIIDTHVVHHLFPRIPFYYADEATAAIRPLLGEFYNEDKKTNFLSSLWSTFRSCRWVKEEKTAPAPGVYHWVKPSDKATN